jgi:hypothetical protein
VTELLRTTTVLRLHSPPFSGDDGRCRAIAASEVPPLKLVTVAHEPVGYTECQRNRRQSQ